MLTNWLAFFLFVFVFVFVFVFLVGFLFLVWPEQVLDASIIDS